MAKNPRQIATPGIENILVSAAVIPVDYRNAIVWVQVVSKNQIFDCSLFNR